MLDTIVSEHMFTSMILLLLAGAQVNVNPPLLLIVGKCLMIEFVSFIVVLIIIRLFFLVI